MISNVEQLIEEANKIENETERLIFVMNYFLETVQYDYSYLFVVLYLRDRISKVDIKGPNVSVNPFSKGQVILNINGEEKSFSDLLCLTAEVVEGQSMLLDEIVSMSHNSDGDVEKFFTKLSELLTRELAKHIGDSEVVKMNVELMISRLRESMKGYRLESGMVDGKKIDYCLTADIKRILIQHILYPNEYMPPVIENGLLKRGVCQHYADYLAHLLPQIGIPAKRVDGFSLSGHAWIAAMVDGQLKSIDLTRAIFVRDHYIGIPEDQKSSDWLIADFEDTFVMQPTRKITGVGMDESGNSIPLPYAMTGENFNKELIISLLTEQKEKKQNK